jgi:hypothetical protein
MGTLTGKRTYFGIVAITPIKGDFVKSEVVCPSCELFVAVSVNGRNRPLKSMSKLGAMTLCADGQVQVVVVVVAVIIASEFSAYRADLCDFCFQDHLKSPYHIDAAPSNPHKRLSGYGVKGVLYVLHSISGYRARITSVTEMMMSMSY